MIVGLMALCRFPHYEMCLKSLCKLVDKVYLRFDGITGDFDIYKTAPDICGKKFGSMFVGNSIWNAYNWREELLRFLDDVKPELVLFPDEDECFDKGVEDDIKRFMKSKKKQLAFNYKYPAPTVDNWKWYKAYPDNPHVKIYKWRKGLTYIPYNRRARLSNYAKSNYKMAKSEILHYCFYTPELRKNKLWNSSEKKNWARKQFKRKKNK